LSANIVKLYTSEQLKGYNYRVNSGYDLAR